MWVSLTLVFVAACGRLHFDDLADTTEGGQGMRSQLVLGVAPDVPLADFPLLVVLDDQRAARELMQPDASDLRFFDAAGNVLAHEIEQLGAPGGSPLVAWVRVPMIEGSSTTLAIDYGHGTPPPASTASVWTASYAGVWHLVDLRDATTYHHDGSWIGGAMAPATGMTGPTLAFAGAGQNAIQIPDDASLAFGQALTVSGWIDPVSLVAASGYACVISRENGTSVDDDFWIGVDNPTAFADAVVSVPSGTQLGMAMHSVPLSSWTHLAMSYDGAIERLYVNGVQVITTVVTGNLRHGAHPILIGADDNSGSALPDADFVDGRVDEIRLESVARPAAWIAYDVASMRDQLITYGPVAR